MDSSTTSDRKLHPTVQNGNEMREKECDYLLLIQTTDQRANPTDLEGPQISIGGRMPSVDAADPARAAGPQPRDVNVNFALFRPGNPKAALDTRITDRPSGDVSSSLMQTMDRVANRVTHELKKK